MENLETVPCGVCGSREFQPLYMARDYIYGNEGEWPVARCVQCSTVLMIPRISPIQIGDYYPKNYYTNVNLEPGRTPLGRALFNAVAASRYGYTVPANDTPFHGLIARMALPFTTRYTLTTKVIAPVPSGRVLDVGCGNGAMLTRYARLGWETYGVEISTDSAIHAIHAGHNVVLGELTDGHYPDEYFDAITMWDSLEHIPNPAEIVCEAYRILKPGGRLYIAVPNFGSWYGRTFRDKWFMFTAPVHYFHYNKETLTNLLAQQGFHEIYVTYPLGGAGLLPTLLNVGRDRPALNRFLRLRPVYRIWSMIDYCAPRGHLHAQALRPL